MNRRTVLKLVGAALLGSWSDGCNGRGEEQPAKPQTMPTEKGPTTMNDNSQSADKPRVEQVRVKVFNRSGELVGPVAMPKVIKTDRQWQEQLTSEQYKIARAKGTERAFCGTLLDNHQNGVYTCVCCGLPLFSSQAKFNSGTGWPSFFQPVAAENVVEHSDDSYGMRRTESLCARCDAHLGHVFDDGPRPTGLRFCMNSESLSFTPADKLATLADPAAPATQAAKT
jgi:methionine-R-sulfoxide reductase